MSNTPGKKTGEQDGNQSPLKGIGSKASSLTKQFKRLFQGSSSGSSTPQEVAAPKDKASDQPEGVIQSVHKDDQGSSLGSYRVVPPPDVPKSILLPQPSDKDKNKICLVVDLDETLVHSAFQGTSTADIRFTINFNGAIHDICVTKRPGVDQFLVAIADIFECVLFTASLKLYADPLMDKLDKTNVFKYRLYRDSCTFYNGTHVKDLTRLGRPMHRVVIIDNSPAAYMFQPDNAIPISSFFDDPTDTELMDLIPFLQKLAKVDDIYKVLKATFVTAKT